MKAQHSRMPRSHQAE